MSTISQTEPKIDTKINTSNFAPAKHPLEIFASENAFVQHRISMFENLQKKQSEAIKKLQGDIKIKFLQSKSSESNLPSELTVGKGSISPFDAISKFNPKIAKNAVIAKVNGDLFDLHRPLVEDCDLELLEFNTKDGQHVFWHSSAHALGECLEVLFGGKLTIGPALENCFYYDADIGDKKISQTDYSQIENLLKKVVNSKQPFERVVLKKDEALEMFKDNQYKCQLIKENIADDAVCTAYRCGPLIDLCRGPHLPSTGLIKAFKIIKHSGCYWKGISTNKQLQRVYGLSFPDKKMLKKRLKEIEEAKLRDHRKIGKDQKLFFFNQLSPGSAFWLPNGAKIYNKLVDLMKTEYRKRGYLEVISPNIYNIDLWKTSGHAEKYSKNFFLFEVEKQQFGMKPMNCPGHCIMFKNQQISYKDLPLRYADFGVLHRNELTGALSGLSRVRRFQQDDAHIFCSTEMIQNEVKSCLKFMQQIYKIFDFKFSFFLSTRPDEFIGEISVWDKAESALKASLEAFGCEWNLNEKDGAFYGPKIDVILHDALGRSIQCATIQLDFNLPSANRFDLQFTNKNGEFENPVIIHRAILGSVERFVAILAEHCGGKWPFWISPRQIMIVPVSEKFVKFGEEVKKRIFDEGFEAKIDVSNNKMQKKIREAQIAQFNLILVVGQKEIDTGKFPVRYRSKKDFDVMSLDELINFMHKLNDSKTNEV